MKENKSKNILRIEKWLNKINYTIHDHGCGHWYIYDDEGDIAQWYIYGEMDTRIELHIDKSFQHSCVFYLKDLQMYTFPKGKKDANTVGFKAKKSPSVFLQFYKRNKHK